MLKANRAHDDRRSKVAYIGGDALLDCPCLDATAPGNIVVKRSPDVPHGTSVLDRFYGPTRRAEGVLPYNEGWPSIPPHGGATELATTTTYIRVEADDPRPPGGQPLADGGRVP